MVAWSKFSVTRHNTTWLKEKKNKIRFISVYKTNTKEKLLIITTILSVKDREKEKRRLPLKHQK